MLLELGHFQENFNFLIDENRETIINGYLKLLILITDVIYIVHRISHGTNVVVVNNQSANSKIFLLPFDWMLTTTTFVPWDILWTMVISLGQRFKD